MGQKKSFTTLYNTIGVSFLVIFALVMLFIDIFQSYRDFNSHSDRMREEYIAVQKKIIKEEVLNVVNMVNSMLADVENEYNSSVSSLLRARLSEIRDVYNNPDGNLNVSGLKKPLKDLLDPDFPDNVIKYDEMLETAKREVLVKISKVRFGKEGYVFVNTMDGDVLVASGRVYDGTRKLWEVFDKNPDRMKELFSKEYSAALKPYGDYIYYSFIKLKNSSTESPKASFIYGIPELSWLVGAGVYLDDVEDEIALNRSALNTEVKKKILYSLLVIAGILSLMLFLLTRLTRRLEEDFNLFISFFGNAAEEDKTIDSDNIRFLEFEKLAESANRMLKEKSEARKELQEEKEQLHVTIHSIGDGVITTDTSGNVEMMNSVAEALTGWTEKDAAGRPVEEVFNIVNEYDRRKVVNPAIRVLKSNRIVTLQNHTLLISKKGGEFCISDSAAPIRDESGLVRGVVLVFRDVTERIKIEKELIESRRMESVTVLAGGIAHDFNNILTGLFGNIKLAKIKIAKDSLAHTYLDDAENALERASHLARQLMTLAKGGNPVLETVDLRTLIKKTVVFDLSGSSVKIHFSFASDLWAVEADKGQISQIISNLAINAKQAMPGGGNLFINVDNYSENGNFVRMVFRDEGTGIPENRLGRIFDPYFTTRENGSGLGLAVVQSIVEKHRGTIHVESEIGKGSVFTVLLPASLTLTGDEGDKQDISDDSYETSRSILLMDDEAMVRSVVKEMLKSRGHRVQTASDGNEALLKYRIEKHRGRAFDVVILDLTIPGGMGGRATAEAILDFDPDAYVIVASGYISDPVLEDYKKYGFKGKLVKPFRIEQLIELLRNMD